MKPLLLIAGIAAVSVAYAVAGPRPQLYDGTGIDTADTTEAYNATDSDAVKEESAIDFFQFADEFETIDPSVRLDMLDYYASGMIKQMPTRLNGMAAIDSIEGGHYIKVTTSAVSETEVRMYDTKSGDKVFAVVNRVKLPATDCRLRVVQTSEKGLVTLPFTAPTVDDFLTVKDKKLRKDLLSRFDFPLVDYHFLPNGDIEARLSTEGYLSREDSAAVAPYVGKTLTYKWDGKNLKLKK